MNVDPFRQMAAAMRTRSGFTEPILSFKKGRWVAGQAESEMKNADVIALVDQTMYGWVKWEDKKPVDYQVGYVAAGYKPPKRGQLGDTDPNKWERQDKDPWQLTFFLPMVDVNGQLYVYSTSSSGGRDAVANLLDAFADHREAYPDDPPLPRVTLSSNHYTHQQHGRVETPAFDITDWVAPPPNVKTIKPPPSSSPALTIDHVAGALPEPKSNNGRGDFDDDIPF